MSSKSGLQSQVLSQFFFKQIFLILESNENYIQECFFLKGTDITFMKE